MVVFHRFPSVSHTNDNWSKECKTTCEREMQAHIAVLPEYVTFIYVNKYKNRRSSLRCNIRKIQNIQSLYLSNYIIVKGEIRGLEF